MISAKIRLVCGKTLILALYVVVHMQHLLKCSNKTELRLESDFCLTWP